MVYEMITFCSARSWSSGNISKLLQSNQVIQHSKFFLKASTLSEMVKMLVFGPCNDKFMVLRLSKSSANNTRPIWCQSDGQRGSGVWGEDAELLLHLKQTDKKFPSGGWPCLSMKKQGLLLWVCLLAELRRAWHSVGVIQCFSLFWLQFAECHWEMVQVFWLQGPLCGWCRGWV